MWYAVKVETGKESAIKTTVLNQSIRQHITIYLYSDSIRLRNSMESGIRRAR